MRLRVRQSLTTLGKSIAIFLTGPQALAFLPALVLGGFWVGGEPLLLVIALGFPVLLALAGLCPGPSRDPGFDHLTEDYERETLERTLDRVLRQARRHLRKTACLLVEIDDFDRILDRHGQTAADLVLARTAERVDSVLRGRDTVITLGPGQLGIAVAPVRGLNYEAGLQMAARIQAAVEEPVTLDSTTVYISASVGLCLESFVPGGSGRDLADAAGLALLEARRHAPSAIRAYSPELERVETCTTAINGELLRALDQGEIRAWFQPQISTDTGNISGFEALARWMHPVYGTVPPTEFLPLLQQAGKMEALGTAILRDALGALKGWDEAGFDVPGVGVNFSSDELRDPKLVDRIAWELDRFAIAPQRLTVEILESVVASSSEDTITRNIRNLGEMGCRIDLDDFGTGHASIASIRRFAVQRLKIDRSFVTKVDRDQEQQRMVNAILLMADQLGLDTLAEGVESAGEHTMLAQLGCGHVQGFGIARPMPLDRTADWITDHLARVQTPPEIGRRIG